MISYNDIVDDVSFGFTIEACRREIYACSDINHMRDLSIRVLQLMESQRIAVRLLINEHQLDGSPSRTALPVDQSGGQDH